MGFESAWKFKLSKQSYLIIIKKHIVISIGKPDSDSIIL